MKGIYFERGENYPISNSRETKVTTYTSGDKEIRYNTFNGINHLKNYIKISKYEVLNKRTGELILCDTNKYKSEESIRKCMSKLKRLLKNNFFGDKNELFITLTCAEDTPVLDLIMMYYKGFTRRIRRAYPDMKMVCVPEMHKDRNSWHLHVLLKEPTRRNLFISNDDIKNLYWRQGGTKTSRIMDRKVETTLNEEVRINYAIEEEHGIDRLINYLCKTQTKSNFPRDAHCYYKSKNVVFPKVEKKKYSEVYDEIKDDYVLKSENTTLIRSSRTDKIIKKIKTEKWRKRK